jgi:hypothetical protein
VAAPWKYRGRAALQRRVEPPKSARDSAPVVAFFLHREPFSNLPGDRLRKPQIARGTVVARAP